jgi:hypothetical protein
MFHSLPRPSRCSTSQGEGTVAPRCASRPLSPPSLFIECGCATRFRVAFLKTSACANEISCLADRCKVPYFKLRCRLFSASLNTRSDISRFVVCIQSSYPRRPQKEVQQQRLAAGSCTGLRIRSFCLSIAVVFVKSSTKWAGLTVYASVSDLSMKTPFFHRTSRSAKDCGLRIYCKGSPLALRRTSFWRTLLHPGLEAALVIVPLNHVMDQRSHWRPASGSAKTRILCQPRTLMHRGSPGVGRLSKD